MSNLEGLLTSSESQTAPILGTITILLIVTEVVSEKLNQNENSDHVIFRFWELSGLARKKPTVLGISVGRLLSGHKNLQFPAYLMSWLLFSMQF
jgi:hypothetical protein